MSFNRSKKKMFDFFLVSRKSKYENFKFLKDGRESRTVKKECTPFYILKGQNRYKWTSFYSRRDTTDKVGGTNSYIRPLEGRGGYQISFFYPIFPIPFFDVFTLLSRSLQQANPMIAKISFHWQKREDEPKVKVT